MASDKGISIKFTSTEKEIVTLFDPDKIEKILNNLLSNALKFTDKSGTILIKLSTLVENSYGVSAGEQKRQKYFEIIVQDTGIGISEKNIHKIFTRFFQGNEAHQTGTGIGLALTNELIKLHNGEINVASNPGSGTTFTLKLPLETEKEALTIAETTLPNGELERTES